MAGWFTTLTINTGVFYLSEENHGLDQDKLEGDKKERKIGTFYLNEFTNMD